jgi:hypothetical protein
MKIGLFTATFLDMNLEDVFMRIRPGHQPWKMPAANNLTWISRDRQGSNADGLKKMLHEYGLIISALANHPEGQIVVPLSERIRRNLSEAQKKRKSNLHTAHGQDRPGCLTLEVPGDRFHRL